MRGEISGANVGEEMRKMIHILGCCCVFGWSARERRRTGRPGAFLDPDVSTQNRKISRKEIPDKHSDRTVHIERLITLTCAAAAESPRERV